MHTLKPVQEDLKELALMLLEREEDITFYLDTVMVVHEGQAMTLRDFGERHKKNGD